MRYGSRAALLALPFVAVALWTRWHLAPRWGDAIAHKMGDVAGLMANEPSAPPAPPATADPGEIAALLDGLDAGAPAIADAGAKATATGAGGKGPARDGGLATTPGGVVHVPASAVEKAIEDGGKNIHGRTIRDASGRPAGVQLSGVSAAHVGLQDGDVVIAVEGKPTMTDDDATEAALGAIGRGATSLRATIARGGKTLDVVLDLPVPGGGADAGKKAR